MATDWSGPWDGEWEGTWFGASQGGGIIFSVAQLAPIPEENAWVVVSPINRATGAAGNYNDGTVEHNFRPVGGLVVPLEHQPRQITRRRVAQTAPLPCQNALVDTIVRRDIVTHVTMPLPTQAGTGWVSVHGRRSREEDELLLLLLEVA